MTAPTPDTAAGPASVTPALLAVQIMLVVLAWNLTRGGPWWLRDSLITVGLAVGVPMLLPPTIRARGLPET